MFHRMCHASSVIVPSAEYSPNIPSSTDAASFTPPMSTLNEFDEDCFIYKVENVKGEPSAAYNVTLLDDQFSSVVSTQDRGYRNALSGGMSSVPGLDDSLEDSMAESVAGNPTCIRNSLFDDDLAAWMRPTEDSKVTIHDERNAGNLSSNCTWNREQIIYESSVTEQTHSTRQENQSFPHLFGSNFELSEPTNLLGCSSIPSDANLFFCEQPDIKKAVNNNCTSFTAKGRAIEVPENSGNTSFYSNLARPVEDHLSGEDLSGSYSSVHQVMNNPLSLQQDIRQQDQFCIDQLKHTEQRFPNSFGINVCGASIDSYRATGGSLFLTSDAIDLARADKTAVQSICSFQKYSSPVQNSSTNLLAYSSSANHEQAPFFSKCHGKESEFADNNSVCSTSLQYQPHPIQSPPRHLFAAPTMASSSTSLSWQPMSAINNEASFSKMPAVSTIISSNASGLGSHLIPRSSKIIASSTVRKPSSFSTMDRKPVKALDLGLMDEANSRITRLQSSDRSLNCSHEMSQPQNPRFTDNRTNTIMDRKGEVVKSKYFISPAASTLGHVKVASRCNAEPVVLPEIGVFQHQERNYFSGGNMKEMGPNQVVK